MQFSVKAAHKNTGEDVSLTIEATSREEAMRRADEMDLVVASISDLSSSSRSASQKNQPDRQVFCRSCGKSLLKQAIACTGCGKAPLAGQDFCWNCGLSTNKQAVVCVHCGVALTQEKQGTKSKIAAGILGILCGGWGVHNFYLGYTGKAIGQLGLWLLGIPLLLIGIGIFMMMGAWIWGLVEGIMILTGSINTDGKGNPLKE